MGNLLVKIQERLEDLSGRCSGNDAAATDIAEYAANIEYRQCLSELGLTPEDLMEGGTI